jgi:2-oxoglutarate ferredoxin oxidoreductase subunit beta
MLGFSNLSFLAQTVDWNPIHLHATLLRAYNHPGLAFVRILQRCPQYTSKVFKKLQDSPEELLLLVHDDGVATDDTLRRIYPNVQQHDPSDIAAARALADRDDTLPIGLLYCDPSRPRYEQVSAIGRDMTPEEKIQGLQREFDRFAV